VNRRTSTAARILAPLAFLAAVTVLVLLVRSALDPEPVASTEPVATDPETAPPAETEEPAEEEPGPATEPPPETEPAGPDATYYEIRSGDTLESIAQDHGTTVERLLELNPGIDPVALTVGERIRIS